MRSTLLFLFLAAALLVAMPLAAAPGGFSVTQSGDKIVISGDKAKKTSSDRFPMSKDAWYVIKIKYSGPNVSVCQLSLATPAMVEKKDTVGGMLTNWMGPKTTELVKSKGSIATGDYVIYADQTDGPWTVEIIRSPKPAALAATKTFSGTADQVTPSFKLNKGQASFVIHQKLKGNFSPRINVNLYNADTGAYVANLCHNSTDPELKGRADIEAAGTYVLEVRGGDAWEISYSQ